MNNKNGNWGAIYQADVDKKGGNIPYILNKINKKKKLIDLIKKYANKNVIECGSGTSVVSIHLASLGYKVTAVDIEDDVIKLSKKLADDYFTTLQDCKAELTFEKKSIFELGYPKESFDVAFSNGVLEHFTDEEIIEILKQQLFVAKTTIVGIPTKYFSPKEAKYGNERVLELSYWRKLIKNAGGIIIEETGMQRQPLNKRLVNFKKYFKPKPYHLFVVKGR